MGYLAIATVFVFLLFEDEIRDALKAYASSKKDHPYKNDQEL